jgi:hypothetical protein
MRARSLCIIEFPSSSPLPASFIGVADFRHHRSVFKATAPQVEESPPPADRHPARPFERKNGVAHSRGRTFVETLSRPERSRAHSAIFESPKALQVLSLSRFPGGKPHTLFLKAL